MTTIDLNVPPTTAVVLGDFGRDAALRFCARLSALERAHIAARLPGNTSFFDEYRRLSLTLVGDLPYVKERVLRAVRGEGGLLDTRVLVGFPVGPRPEDVAARLAVLALQALRDAYERGSRRALVLLPCNSLAPALWAIEGALTSAGGAAQLWSEADPAPSPELERWAEVVASEMELSFPSVPEAVLKHCPPGAALLPIGTEAVGPIYREALARLGLDNMVLGMKPNGQRSAAATVKAAVSGDEEIRATAVRTLQREIRATSRALPGGITVVEACTDLSLGLGVSSTELYAKHVVAEVYGDEVTTG